MFESASSVSFFIILVIVGGGIGILAAVVDYLRQVKSSESGVRVVRD